MVDLYWDTSNRRFGLCPAEVPTVHNDDDQIQPVRTGKAALFARPFPAFTSLLAARQTIAPSNTSTSTLTSLEGNSTIVVPSTTTQAAVVQTVAPSGNVLYEIGPYTCSSSLDISTLVDTLDGYITLTSNTIEARLQYIVFNLHAAATASNPTTPRQSLSPSELPRAEEVLSESFDRISGSIYTPDLLDSERQNLNASWYALRGYNYTPRQHYFNITTSSNGDLSTPDGWPNEDYAQLQRGWRFLTGYGSVDESMNNYNFLGDKLIIFSPGVLYNNHPTTVDDRGNVVSGCFYDSNETSVSQVDNSWAASTLLNVDQSILSYAADNLTICGISPLLNMTLNDAPANDNNYEPYQNFGNQALFSWASGEPKNRTTAEGSYSSPSFACALMVSNDDYKGHWRTANCETKYRVACREANQPYVWQISSRSTTYSAGPDTCSGNSSFDVPRTGLENLYLWRLIQSEAVAQNDDSLLDGIWVNFNSINVEDCWITTGPNGTCPYYEDQDSIKQRQVLIPAIGAFIVLLLTALTILVKCNNNRRNSKVRKRGEGGWDYEGVPS